jgi:hypothetical protein
MGSQLNSGRYAARPLICAEMSSHGHHACREQQIECCADVGGVRAGGFDPMCFVQSIP